MKKKIIFLIKTSSFISLKNDAKIIFIYFFLREHLSRKSSCMP